MQLLSLLFSASLALSCLSVICQSASIHEILVGALGNFIQAPTVTRYPVNTNEKSETGISNETPTLINGEDDEEEVEEEEDQDFEDDDDDAIDVDGVVGNVNSIAHLHRKNGEILIPCFGMWWPAGGGGGGFYDYGGGYYYTGDYKRKRKRSKKQKKSAKSRKKKA